MAKFPVYSYRDMKVGFGQPIVESNEYSAIRGFQFAIMSNNGMMNFAPADYELYKIGEFDSDKGIIEPCMPVCVYTGSEALLNKEK